MTKQIRIIVSTNQDGSAIFEHINVGPNWEVMSDNDKSQWVMEYAKDNEMFFVEWEE